MQKRRKALVIVGPTASGKSALAVALAREFNGEIISADSRQVYKGLDLGTGKITKREMKGVPHHLLNEVSPHRIFTAHDFAARATKAAADISSKGKLPIVTGGTGFYIDVLVGRIVPPNVPMNDNLRKRFEKMTAEQLFMLLKKRDPRRAKIIDRHNKRRLVRALEIVSALGKIPVAKITGNSRYDTLWIGISRDKKELKKLIRARMRARMKAGMISEAIKLHRKGLSYKRMESLGLEYRSLALFLQKKISRKELEKKIARDSVNYAKRQMTYWNRNREIQWFATRHKKKIPKTVSNWLKK
ncbi:MAG: tRNA (adenosine(37)-N6)-dimethylallyltransferase MiaA [Patescibacteria group bacterium]